MDRLTLPVLLAWLLLLSPTPGQGQPAPQPSASSVGAAPAAPVVPDRPPLAGAGAAPAARIDLSWLLGGAGSLSAAAMAPGPDGAGQLRGIRLALPALGLEADVAELDSPAAPPAAGRGSPPETQGSSEAPLRLRGVRATVALGTLLRPPPAAGPTPAPAEPAAPPPAGKARPARPAPPAAPGGRSLHRLLTALGRLTEPRPAGLLGLLPALGLEQGQLTLTHPRGTLQLDELALALRPGRELRGSARLRGPLGLAGRLRLRLDWPVRTAAGALQLTGELALEQGTVAHPALAAGPLQGLAGEGAFVLLHDPAKATLRLTLAPWRVQGLEARLELGLDRFGTGPLAGKLLLDLPAQPCQRLADALPRALAPRLDDLRLEGQLGGGGLSTTFDLRRAAEPVQTLRLVGRPLLERCRPVSLGRSLDVERLRRRFVQTITPVRPDLAPLQVGSGSRDYLPLTGLPPHVARSMLLTEDAGFHHHGPLALGLIRKAINLDLRGRRYVYGGSTISQQLVKNLFLDGEKSLARKVQEAFIAWKLERTLTKDRILELYVNCIEFAPGIYGIERAARYYFGHGAADLTPVEGVFLATIKPLPSDGPRMARNGKVDGWWIKRMAEVMGQLARQGLITPDELQRAAPFQPLFRPDFVENSRRVVRRRPATGSVPAPPAGRASAPRRAAR